MSQKPPNAFARLCAQLQVVAISMHRNSQLRSLDSERLRALEDRVARLDRGDDSRAARHNALHAVKVAAICENRPAPDLRIAAKDKLEFTGDLSEIAMKQAKQAMKGS